ncbi:MAG: hypothetical protein ACW98D_14845 [Promethearchaeota archaeon]|jgi:hypothetical protein
MSGKEDYNFSKYVNNAQKRVKEFVLEKNQLNSKLKNYILNFQSIDSEIYKSLFNAREFYNEKRYGYNIKLEKLRIKKKEYELLWNRLNKELKTFSKPEIDSNISVSIEYTKKSLEDIEYNIDIIHEKLEDQILEIDVENEIIEKLREFEENKKKKTNLLVELERKQTTKVESSDFYKTQRRIESLEMNLEEIYETLMKLSYKRLMTHKKMLNLYRKTREFESLKNEFVMILDENNTTSEEYHQLYLKLMDQNIKNLKKEFSNRPRSKVLTRAIKKPNVKAIINNKKKYKRLEKKKLAIALNKQKAGKKLDFYELKLILKHSKNIE